MDTRYIIGLKLSIMARNVKRSACTGDPDGSGDNGDRPA
jgi:hypothetical protein